MATYMVPGLVLTVTMLLSVIVIVNGLVGWVLIGFTMLLIVNEKD